MKINTMVWPVSELISKCPLIGKCGGCRFDFSDKNYRKQKLDLLKNVPLSNAPIWIVPGNRRRAEFSYLNSEFGFMARYSNDIVPVCHCPVLTDTINSVLPKIAQLPFVGYGNVLITECANGLDVSVINPTVLRAPTDMRGAVDNIREIIRMTWGGAVVKQTAQPIIKFDDKTINYNGGFLQPTVIGENVLRKLVLDAVSADGRVADLFCGQGTFTYALKADGFDTNGAFKMRDLFVRPLRVSELNKYNCVVMDPPRAGALAQCAQLAKSNVPCVVYASCNPKTFMRDLKTLVMGGYRLVRLTPVDQFVGSHHFELVGVFQKSIN